MTNHVTLEFQKNRKISNLDVTRFGSVLLILINFSQVTVQWVHLNSMEYAYPSMEVIEYVHVKPGNIIYPTGKHDATVYFLHPWGGSGAVMKEMFERNYPNISLDNIKFIFPTSPFRNFSFLKDLSYCWFDRKQLDPYDQDDLPTLNKALEEFTELFENEFRNTSVPYNRIVVGGFSQGGEMAMHLGYRHMNVLAGVFVFSAFLNYNSSVYQYLRDNSPDHLPELFYYQGGHDVLLKRQWSRETFENLTSYTRFRIKLIKGKYRYDPNGLHSFKKKHMRMLFDWLRKLLPPVNEKVNRQYSDETDEIFKIV